MTKCCPWLAGWLSLLCSGSCLWAADAAPAGDARALAAKIDAFIAARWQKEQVQPAAQADDAEFLRRVYLDLAGHIPSATEARRFLDDPAADKRRRLIEQLLASPAYVTHFTNYWRDLLLPDADTSAEAQGLAPEFENWLRRQVTANTPYNRLVREVVTYPFDTNRRPMLAQVNAGDTPTPRAYYLAKDVKPENLAASTARLFLGVRLECAQCHNHPFAQWKREQFWGYAAFFAGLQRQRQQDSDGPGVIREVFDRRELGIPGSSQVVAAAFLDGTEPRWRFKVGSRVTLADWMTSPNNPYFARAAANRLWGYFFGTGLVDPVDDLGGEHPPSHPELLDELARQFAAHQFDWKFLIRAITASRAYQLSSAVSHPSQEPPQRFARMAIKGLTGAQVFDSLVQATGYQEPKPAPQPDGLPPQQTNPARAAFLARFGSNLGEKPTEAQTSILQALALMNGRFMADLTRPKGKGTLASVANDAKLTTEQRLEALFLSTLSRRPTAAETARLARYVESGGPDKDGKQALADVFWALLNSGEFILNH